MKKILVLASFFVFVACNVSFAAPLVAGDVTSIDGLQVFGGVDPADASAAGSPVLIGKMSKGVYFSSYYTVGGYSLVTKHLSGTKCYGTAHDSTAIYFKDVAAQTLAAACAPTAADTTNFGAAWTSM